MPVSEATGLTEKANSAAVTLQGDAVLFYEAGEQEPNQPPVQPQIKGKLRFEAWTLPTAATFERKVISLPVESASGRRELSAFSDCQCTIPQSFSGLATLSTAPLIRVYDGSTVVDEFVAERAPRPLDFGEFVAYSGPQLGQWGLSRILVYPPDYGTNPSKRPNWRWGMENLIELDVGGLGNTNEEWSLYLSGERYELDTSLGSSGTFTLTAGGNTTSAIDYDATASTIQSALEGLAGITTVTVDQPDPDTREFFVVFENPKNLGTDATANFGSMGGTGVFTKLSDGFDTGSDPTFTITVDGQTTSNLAWDATANQVEGSATGNTGLQGLSNVSDVAVSGSGTYDDPWLITFFNPPDIDSFTVTFTGTAVYSRTVAGGYSSDPVTISKPIDEGTGPEEVHGSYGNPPLEVVTDAVDTGADWSLLVRARSTFAGSQIVLNVEEGELYQSSIRVRPAADSEYVLVIHDENQNQIARTSDTAISADTWATLSLSDILIPAGVERVIMRVAVVSSTTGNHYVNWQGAEFITGLAPTNPGDIVSTILDWSQTQGDGDWIDVTFDDSTDTASTSWTQDYSYQADGFAMHLLHVLEDMRDLGYEFTLTPKSSPSAGKTHDLNLYMPEGAGTDRTTTGPALVTGGAIVGGQVVDRIPDFTVGVAWGADDLYLEDENATTKASYGRLTRVFDVEHHGNSDSLQDVLDTAFDDEESNRQAASVTLRGSGSDVPFVDFTVGDTLVWQAADRMAKNDRRVATITWKHRAGEVAEYEVQGSRVWGDPIAAIAEGLRRLLDAPKKRKRNEGGPGIDRTSTSVIGQVGAHIHLERAATQSIGTSGAEAISWDSSYAAISRVNFADPALPADAVTIQEPGYYNVAIQLGWDSFEGGGNVTVVRLRDGDEATVWPPSSDPDSWSTTDGQVFEAVAPAIPCLSGDQIKVYVDHGDGSSQDLGSATLGLYLVDRTDPSVVQTDIDVATYIEDTVSTSHDINLPTASAGDLLLAIVSTGNSLAGVTMPAGWTSLEQITGTTMEAEWIYKVADGTEGLTATVTSGSNINASSIAWVIRDPDIDWSTLTPDSNSVLNNFDAPSVSLSHGAGKYAVFVAVGETNYLGLSGPDGFEELAQVDLGTPTTPGSYVGYAYAFTSGPIDPGVVSFDSEGGSNRNRLVATIAVRVSG